MTDTRQAALQYAHQNRQRFLDELIELSRISSISTDPGSKAEMQRAAEWLADHLKKLGVEHVTIHPTPGHPVVYGDLLNAGPTAPVVLIYGHYDVQPPEPLELWESGPFEPTIRGENIYARGITDMKGQVLAACDSIEAIVRTGTLPVNVKFLLEGEEEIGSPNLKPFIASHTDLLKCDFALNPDAGTLTPEQPSITYALRGMAYFELRITGPDHDLHSGTYGGAVHNPATVLCELIAGMHDDQGRITLPGFYDRVRALPQEERDELSRLPVSDQDLLDQTGSPALFGEAGYSSVERTGARPTLEVNGLLSGYTGAGAKTVLPSKAMAKLSMRLVPDQDPKEVHEQLTAYLNQCAPKTVKWELDDLVGGPASISDRSSKAVRALGDAMETVWGVRPVFKREGGSVPVVNLFQEYLKVESVNTGFSMPDDRAHSPNEKLHLPTWYKGIDAFINYFFNLVES